MRQKNERIFEQKLWDQKKKARDNDKCLFEQKS